MYCTYFHFSFRLQGLINAAATIHNVLYHYFDHHHYFNRLEARFVKYDDSDSESNNILFLLCDVSRS
jgi:hypothetical protein